MQTSKEYFNVLTILHTAFLVTQLMFAGVAFYLNTSGQITSDQNLTAVFQFVVPVVIVGAILASSVVFKAQLKSIKLKTELKEKMNDYRTSVIIKFALLEAPSMVALVCYLLTANFLFLGSAFLVIIFFLMNRPSPESAANDLELSPADRLKILDPNAVVAEIKSRNK